MQQENSVKLDKKSYQVLVVGHYDEQDNSKIFVQTPSNVSEELLSRGLGGSRYLNLRLIEDFNSQSGDFGGSSDSEQATLFESTSPEHFSQLVKAIENNKFSEEPDRKIRNAEGKDVNVPIIKLDGKFKDSAIHVEGVDPFYLVFRRDGEYELQITERYIGNEWVPTPSTLDWVSVVLLGSDAQEGKVLPTVEREKRRMNVEAFNKDEIRDLARQTGVNINDIDAFKTWIASIAPSRIKAVYGAEDEANDANVNITEGQETGQPPANTNTPDAQQVAATGTDGKPAETPPAQGQDSQQNGQGQPRTV